MKTRSVSHLRQMTLGICAGMCLGTASLMTARPATAQQAATVEHNIARTTPDQQARMNEIEQLDNAAVAALDARQYAEAEADARQSVLLGIEAGKGQELLAEALYAQDKDQQALQVYQTMAQQGNDAPRNLIPYALLLLKIGDWPDALAAYEKALRLVPEQTSPVYPHLNQAFTFSPDDPQPAELAAATHVAFALVYDTGATWETRPLADRAEAEYRRALQIAPGWDMANFYYGDFLQRHGRTAEAQATFAKTLKLAHGGVKVAARKALAKLRPA